VKAIGCWLTIASLRIAQVGGGAGALASEAGHMGTTPAVRDFTSLREHFL
jgi:hypothetical protein